MMNDNNLEFVEKDILDEKSENVVGATDYSSGLNIETIVFTSCTIKPNPFVTKKSSKVNRM